MPATHEILCLLREKASQTRVQLEEEENAILVIERMLSDSTGTTPLQQVHQASIIEAPTVDKVSFRDKVRAIIPLFDGADFTVLDIYERLIANSVEVESKERVSMALSKMLKQNDIDSVKKGVGRSPSVYKEKV